MRYLANYFGLMLLLGAVAAIFVSHASAEAREKHALVVANWDYLRASADLDNPKHDADLVASSLSAKGFRVERYDNLTNKALLRAVRAFAKRMRDTNNVALVYYSGHGAKVKGANYLIPTDAELVDEGDAPVEALRLQDIMNLLERKVTDEDRAAGIYNRGLNVVILDACRNNPYPGRGLDGGLAKEQAATGTLVWYATRPNEKALDNIPGSSRRNGPFAVALSQALEKPGLNAQEVFGEVKLATLNLTRGEQEPWQEGSVVGSFRFTPGARVIQRVRHLAEFDPRAAEQAWSGRPLSVSRYTRIRETIGHWSTGKIVDHKLQGYYGHPAKVYAWTVPESETVKLAAVDELNDDHFAMRLFSKEKLPSDVVFSVDRKHGVILIRNGGDCSEFGLCRNRFSYFNVEDGEDPELKAFVDAIRSGKQLNLYDPKNFDDPIAHISLIGIAKAASYAEFAGNGYSEIWDALRKRLESQGRPEYEVFAEWLRNPIDEFDADCFFHRPRLIPWFLERAVAGELEIADKHKHAMREYAAHVLSVFSRHASHGDLRCLVEVALLIQNPYFWEIYKRLNPDDGDSEEAAKSLLMKAALGGEPTGAEFLRRSHNLEEAKLGLQISQLYLNDRTYFQSGLRDGVRKSVERLRRDYAARLESAAFEKVKKAISRAPAQALELLLEFKTLFPQSQKMTEIDLLMEQAKVGKACEQAGRYWTILQDSEDLSMLHAYENDYPNCPQAALARARRLELEASE